MSPARQQIYELYNNIFAVEIHEIAQQRRGLFPESSYNAHLIVSEDGKQKQVGMPRQFLPDPRRYTTAPSSTHILNIYNELVEYLYKRLCMTCT